MSAGVFLKAQPEERRPLWTASAISGIITALFLVLARIKAPFPILLADRFLPGSGWVQIGALALYGAFVTSKFSQRRDNTSLRLKIWLLFSLVFFTQFVLGIAGIQKLLMTGRLHIPVPAVVIAGPIFRGHRFFMPILFLCTVILVGPAWCSYLCYFGAWDGLAATRRKRAGRISSAWVWLRCVLFAATPSVAIGLRALRVDSVLAGIIAICFGALGATTMVALSTRSGTMAHCTFVCPLGLVGNILGRINPFRIRISSACTECARCFAACRYNALDLAKVQRRRPGYTCTLCGDCVAACRDEAISYSFGGLTAGWVRPAFLVLVISLHAVFLGVARI